MRESHSVGPLKPDPLDAFPGARALLEERTKNSMSLSPDVAVAYLLEEAIEHFGYAARDVFHAVFDYTGIIKHHQAAFSVRYTKLVETVSALATNSIADHAISNLILALSPLPDNTGPFAGVNWRVDFKSDWIARSVVMQLDEAESIAIRQEINLLDRIPEGREIARWFLEPIVRIPMTMTEGDIWPLFEMFLMTKIHRYSPCPRMPRLVVLMRSDFCK